MTFKPTVKSSLSVISTDISEACVYTCCYPQHCNFEMEELLLLSPRLIASPPVTSTSQLPRAMLYANQIEWDRQHDYRFTNVSQYENTLLWRQMWSGFIVHRTGWSNHICPYISADLKCWMPPWNCPFPLAEKGNVSKESFPEST